MFCFWTKHGFFGRIKPTPILIVILSEAKNPLISHMKRRDYYVYILASDSGTLYIGVTNDLERRVSEHKQNLIDGFSKKYGCHRLVYYEYYGDVNQAIEREKYLKGKVRSFKENLIKSINPTWKDLSAEWS